jgi:hypothetical protein
MVIKLNLTHISETLKDIVISNIKDITDVPALHKSSKPNNSVETNALIFINENRIEKIKEILQDILTRHSLSEYIIAENTEDENEIVILKQGDMEQFGVYICSHCSMSFKSKNLRSLHERVHYFT